MLERIKAFIESTAGAITLLFFGLCLFSVVCIVIAIRLPANEHLAMLFTGIVGGFNGSLFTVITVHARNSAEVTGKDSTVTINQAEPKSDGKS
jgi:hypothetical protein